MSPADALAVRPWRVLATVTAAQVLSVASAIAFLMPRSPPPASARPDACSRAAPGSLTPWTPSA